MLNLDEELARRNAQPYPCCPVRREVNANAYTEFVKQISASRPELGSLLQTVREAIQAPIALYEGIHADAHLVSTRQIVCPTDPSKLPAAGDTAPPPASAPELPPQFRITPRSLTSRYDLMEAVIAARLRNAALEERNRLLRSAIRTEADRAADAAAADLARHNDEAAALKKTTAQAIVEAKRAQQ